ncbi:neuropeptide receptor 15 [Biomphalaria pfeifferi]|uniref:Neuropeptide receptor 15 n=1 Tax=Biomphalaria pfeifferi TaxID=112525 RepID=A0AAD8FJE4_BIOPF|nr:neuropeptide receptor 15 [Biomphalaria pfeifferi]
MNESNHSCRFTHCDVVVSGLVTGSDVASDYEKRISQIILDFVVNFSVCFFGIFSNSVVIIVFAKQGFKDSTAISMTTVSLWDLVKCVAGFIQRLEGPLELVSLALAYSYTNISLVVCNYLVSFSCYVTSVLAAYVAVERCLCVIIPLKVKWLLTPKVALGICVTISVVVFGCFVIIFGIYDVFLTFDPHFNATVAIFKYNSFSNNNKALFGYYNMSGTLWPMVSLVVIVISTVIISYKLKKAAEFRYRTKTLRKDSMEMKSSGNNQMVKDKSDSQGMEKSDKTQRISKRDQQVIKMLLVVIVIYMVNLFPRVGHYLTKFIVFDYYYLRRYNNLFSIMAYAIFVFDYVNGSVNVIIFYFMSTSFRETTRNLFGCRAAVSNI